MLTQLAELPDASQIEGAVKEGKHDIDNMCVVNDGGHTLWCRIADKPVTTARCGAQNRRSCLYKPTSISRSCPVAQGCLITVSSRDAMLCMLRCVCYTVYATLCMLRCVCYAVCLQSQCSALQHAKSMQHPNSPNLQYCAHRAYHYICL